jgi:hypothetical protein
VALLSYALVTGGTVAVRHRNWYCIGGLCDIKARYKDELKPWQPDQASPRHKRGAGGYWRMACGSIRSLLVDSGDMESRCR